MFIDASAIVAILLREDDHIDLLARIEAIPRRHTSVVALFEAVLGTSKKFGVVEARRTVESFVETVGIDVLPVDADLLASLSDTYDRYGKRSGHPAKLNMGDCYSYALAKRSELPLLYKGDDFARTDLA